MIKFVIFDVGGVLLKLGEQAYRQGVVSRLGLAKIPTAYIDAVPALQRGEIDETDLWRRLAGTAMSSNSFDDLFRTHFLPVDEMLSLAADLREQGLGTAILSNTQKSHARVMRDMDFVRAFDPVFFSCEIGCRKPERGIFARVLRDLNLQAGEVVFIDDVEEYLEAASGVGIHTVHHKGDVASTRARIDALIAR